MCIKKIYNVKCESKVRYIQEILTLSKDNRAQQESEASAVPRDNIQDTFILLEPGTELLRKQKPQGLQANSCQQYKEVLTSQVIDFPSWPHIKYTRRFFSV